MKVEPTPADVGRGSASPAAAALGCPTTPLARSGRVLIIDDERIIVRAIERTLGAEHDVFSANSAGEALDRIVAGERFDVILCDLMMPKMSGIELHAALCGVAPDQAARIIFLTGGAFTARGRDFLGAIPNRWMGKPFDVHELRALVLAQMGARLHA